MRLKTGPFLLVVAALVGATSTAQAVTISVTSTANNSTANFSEEQIVTSGFPPFTSTVRNGTRQIISALATTNAGGSSGIGIGDSVSAATRFTDVVSADRDGGGDRTTNFTGDYTINFSTSAVGGYTYDLDLSTILRGGLTVLDDGLGAGAAGSASISAFTATLVQDGGSPTVIGALGTTAASQGGTSNTSGVQTSVNQSNGPTSITGLTGNHTFSLRFQWTQTATSTGTVADEAAGRFGIQGTVGGQSADNYGGVGNRDINADGHFVTMTARITAVPEPSTFALAGLGAVGVGLAAWRRRRAA